MREGELRRKEIMEALRQSKLPVSGAELSKRFGVSRQVIVQDIALLRADNKEVLSTNKGYVFHKPFEGKAEYKRVFRTNHANQDTLDELYTVVDLGGRVLDVSIEHELYGQIRVDLIINNRLDAAEFVNHMERSRDLPLKSLTGGCHYHTVVADSEKYLDFIEEALSEKGYLT